MYAYAYTYVCKLHTLTFRLLLNVCHLDCFANKKQGKK